jgi:hypothetical protein
MHVCVYVDGCTCIVICIMYMTLLSLMQWRLGEFVLISWLLRKCRNRKEFVNLSFLFSLFVWPDNDNSFN